jgi:hypothetical protein
MSKMDGLRALREARYEAERKAAPVKRAAAGKKITEPPEKRVETAAGEARAPAAADASLCGHRSMNGRTCTREQGHAAKSHRYS